MDARLQRVPSRSSRSIRTGGDMSHLRNGYLTPMNYFGRDYNPLLVTVFLIVWIIVGVLQILGALRGM